MSPFDELSAEFLVLRNEHGQHSLWPVFALVPSGWSVVFGAAPRRECVAYLEVHWSHLRPNTLIRAAVRPL